MSSIAELVEAYLDHLRVERGVSPHTSAAYGRDLRRYVEHLTGLGISDPTMITPGMIDTYAITLREGVRDEDGGWRHPPLAATSAARMIVAVRSLHRFGLEEGVTVADPARSVAPPKPGRRLPKALSQAQVQAMLDSPLAETELGLRDLALLELLYGTGARISEVIDLDVDDITPALEADPETTPSVRVLGKGRKERFVPVGSFARRALQAYLVRSRPVLAARGRGTPALLLNVRGSRLSRQSAWTVVQTAAERAGITTEVSPHTLRHSFATHLLDGGADVRVVQELLGHASVTTTQIYTLVTVDHLREVYLTAHPRAY